MLPVIRARQASRREVKLLQAKLDERGSEFKMVAKLDLIEAAMQASPKRAPAGI